MTARQYIERILELQKKRDYNSAYNLLQDALFYYPSNTFLQTSEVYLLMRLGRLEEARQKAELRINLLKDTPFFLKTYIEILMKEKDKRGLIEIAERLKTTPVRDENLYVFLAKALVRIKEKERALGLLNAALLYMPEGGQLRELLDKLSSTSEEEGINYYRERYKGVPPERVIEEIEDILILPEYGEDISLRLFLGELYRKTGDLKKAEGVYRECLKIKDSLYIRKMLGFIYYRMDELDKALLYLREPFLQEPSDHALYNTVSKIIERTGRIKEGEALIIEALSRHPEARHLYGILKRLRKRADGI